MFREVRIAVGIKIGYLKVYKVLMADGKSAFQGYLWSLPGEAGPGLWEEADRKWSLELCGNGIHGCLRSNVREWYVQTYSHWNNFDPKGGRAPLPRIFEMEVSGGIRVGKDKICARRGRLIREIPQADWFRLFGIST